MFWGTARYSQKRRPKKSWLDQLPTMAFSLNVMESQWMQRIQQSWRNQLCMNWGQFKNSVCHLWLGDWVFKTLAYHVIGHKSESCWFRIFLVTEFIELSKNLGKTQILNVPLLSWYEFNSDFDRPKFALVKHFQHTFDVFFDKNFFVPLKE